MTAFCTSKSRASSGARELFPGQRGIMNPLIQYTTTNDGVRIAYYTMGGGVPFIATSPLQWSHLGNTLQFKEHYRSRSPGGLGPGLLIVRYDGRGTGLSDQEAIDFSIDAQMRDLQSVVDALALERFVLFGYRHGSILAISFAASFPGRVSHLVLALPHARGRDIRPAFEEMGLRAAEAMTPEEWKAHTHTLALASYGFATSPAAEAVAQSYRESMTPASYHAFLKWRETADVSELLEQVTVPTLVLSRRTSTRPRLEVEVATRIPGAVIVTNDADEAVPGRWLPAESEAVLDFLGISTEPALATDHTKVPPTPREPELRSLPVSEASSPRRRTAPASQGRQGTSGGPALHGGGTQGVVEPRIQYALTADGVRIAYWVIGDGPPLVHTPPPVTHIEFEWQFEESRLWYESLARNRTLIRYDARGQGLSERGVDAISLETQILDLEAVIGRLRLQTFDLFGVLWHGPAAIAYAAHHPDAVSKLVLWSVSPHGDDLLQRALQASRDLMDVDWKAYTEMVAHVSLGWSRPAVEAAEWFAALIRAAMTPEMMRRTAAATASADVSALLSRVACPTLILHRRDAAFPPMSAVRRLAEEIPNASVALLEGEAQAPYVGDAQAVVRAFEEFLEVEERGRPATAAGSCVPADAARTRGAVAARRRPEQPLDRGGAGAERADGGAAHRQHLREDRRSRPRRGHCVRPPPRTGLGRTPRRPSAYFAPTNGAEIHRSADRQTHRPALTLDPSGEPPDVLAKRRGARRLTANLRRGGARCHAN